MIERNIKTVKVNNEYLMKSYEEFVAGIILESEYQSYKKSFEIRIQAAENNINALREELSQLENDIYLAKPIERFLEHKGITELERSVVARLIKSIVVNSSDDISINFRYFNGFKLPINYREN